MLKYFFAFSTILLMFKFTVCWVNTEMQMFDLVEEVNQNFYEFLGLDENATNVDIRRAYRKLSLIHHPDKNPNSEDAIKFRRLVAIYEILRDDKMRERYNEVLKFGLPDWRMPAFYFRKLRKMSFAESFLLFAILATIIHYACLWGAFFEQKLNMEAYLFRNKKKRNIESEMNEQLNTVYKPRWKDILPLAIVKFVYNFVVSIPQNVKILYGLIKKEISTIIDKQFEQKRKEKAKQEEKKKLENIKKQKKDRKQVFSIENKEKRKLYEIGKQNAMTLPVETFNDIPTIINEKEENNELQSGPWSDKDTVAVIRALAKFPAGVTDRWLKISDFVKRPLGEVTKKVKEIQASSKEKKIPINTRMQNSLGDGVEEQFEQDVIYIQPHLIGDNYSSESESKEDDDDEEINVKSSAQKKKERKKLTKQMIVPITKLIEESSILEDEIEDNVVENEQESSVHLRKKPRTKAKYMETSELIDVSSWTQIEQKQLEDAMRAFPKGTTDRWDRISQKIPTKTKVECIERIKKLSQTIQEKSGNK